MAARAGKEARLGRPELLQQQPAGLDKYGYSTTVSDWLRSAPADAINQCE